MLPLFVEVLCLVLVFVVQYLVSFLVLQSSVWYKEGWLLFLYCPLDVMWLLSVLRLFLTVPWVCLQCVIVVFPA